MVTKRSEKVAEATARVEAFGWVKYGGFNVRHSGSLIDLSGTDGGDIWATCWEAWSKGAPISKAAVAGTNSGIARRVDDRNALQA